ncbi:hypothetical protein HKX48_008642, partial [Thoreauomyces humboldtii]
MAMSNRTLPVEVMTRISNILRPFIIFELDYTTYRSLIFASRTLKDIVDCKGHEDRTPA